MGGVFRILALLFIPTVALAQVTRDGNGYAQWPHSNQDGITSAPCYDREKYPGEYAKWSMSSSDDPAVVEQYRRVLEEYDRVHGTRKNPYPPLPRPLPRSVPQPTYRPEFRTSRPMYIRWW